LIPINVLGYSNWWWGNIRTTDAAANYAFMSLVFLSPLALMLFVWRLFPRSPAFLTIAIILPWAVWCGFLGLCSSATTVAVVVNGFDASYAYLHSVRRTNDRLALYRTNGGATTDWGVVVRQEEFILPGVVRVKRVHDYYHCYEAEITQLDEQRIRVRCTAVSTDGSPSSEPEATVMLAPHVLLGDDA